jgi:hypothetical protein
MNDGRAGPQYVNDHGNRVRELISWDQLRQQMNLDIPVSGHGTFSDRAQGDTSSYSEPSMMIPPLIARVDEKQPSPQRQQGPPLLALRARC